MVIATKYPWSGAAKTQETKLYPWSGAAGEVKLTTPTPEAPTTEYPYTGKLGEIPGLKYPVKPTEAVEAPPVSDDWKAYLEGAVGQIPTYTIEPRDVGLPGLGFDWKGEGFRRPDVDLTFGIDWDIGTDIYIYHEDKKIGIVDIETGNIKLDDPDYILRAMTPSYWDRQQLKLEGKYPAELPLAVIGAIDRWLKTPMQVDVTPRVAGKWTPPAPGTVEEKLTVTYPSPGTILGIIGLIGSLSIAGYQGITALQQVGWSGVRNELLTPFKSTLDLYIRNNAKDIMMKVRNVTPDTLSRYSRVDRTLYHIYRAHNEYMAKQAAAIFEAQRVGKATSTVNNIIKQLTTATQTTNNIANTLKTGTELTTTSINALIVTGTPTEFVSGITGIALGQVAPLAMEGIPMPTAVQEQFLVQAKTWLQQVPEVKPNSLHTVGIAEGEAFIRTDTAGNPLVVGTSHLREGQLTLDTIVATPGKEIAVGKALIDVGEYLKSEGIAFPPRVEMSPEAIRVYDKLVAKGEVPEYAPTTAMAEWETVTGEGIPIGKVEVSRFVAASEARRIEIKSLLAEPAKNLPEGVTKVALRKELESITEQLATVSKGQKAKAHIIASEKALITKAGKATPQYRRLAEGITGKRTMKEMTLEEASDFIEALEKYPEKKWSAETGKWIPQSIPETRAIVPENYFNLTFGEPTPIKYFTSQTYYATKLGAGPLVEPLEIAKQELDLVYPAWRGAIDTKINELNKAYKVTTAEKLAAAKANKPTRASVEMAQLLNKYEDLPPALVDSLGMGKVKIFSWFRNLSRTMLNGQNQVREILGMPLIPHREAYFSHIASKTAEEVMVGTHPLPSDLAYWSKQVVGKKVFNPRAIQRQLKDDLLEYFSRDLGYVTKSMVNVALKEIYLSQPLKAFNAQLNALNKGLMPFDSLTPAELKKAALINPMPASTRKWLVDYVNVVIKGQQTELDASINRVITQTGIGGLFDKFLLPFGRSVGLKPATRISQFLGRSIIYATIGTKPRQIIRNLQQCSQDLALNGIVPTLKAFLPADKNLSRMLDESLFLKSYAIIEEMPTAGMSKIARKWMWAYGKSAVLNARKSMKGSYHSKLHYAINKADAKYGWADPARTYTEPKGFLYDSEYKKLLKEAEFASGAAQYQYNPIGMPEVFRHKTLVPLTRLQSWWMNYFFKFHREALSRFWNGHVGWEPNLKLNWSDRLGWFKYLIIGGAILTALGYERSFGRDVLPHWSPPGAQMIIGIYNYVIADSDYEREKAQKQMFYSLRAFVPGLIDYNHYKDIWSGEKPLSSLFFYSEDWPPDMPTWGIPALVAEVELGHRIERINEDIGEWTNKLGTLIPAEDETDAYTYEMTDLASDIWAELRNVPEVYRTKEKGFSDIVLMYNEASTLWEEHYYSLPASERQEFIKQDDPTSIQVGAYLVLWGKLKATGWASGNPETIALVEQLINQYNIPPDAVPGMGELKERGEEREEGEYPWSGAVGGEPTLPGATIEEPSEGGKKYPWSGAAGRETAQMGFPLEQLISKLGAKGEPMVSGKYTRPAEMPAFPEGTFPKIGDVEDLGEPSEESISFFVDKYGFTPEDAKQVLATLNKVDFTYQDKKIETESDLIKLIDRMSMEFTPHETMVELYKAAWGGLPQGEGRIPPDPYSNRAYIMEKAKEFGVFADLGIDPNKDPNKWTDDEMKRLLDVLRREDRELAELLQPITDFLGESQVSEVQYLSPFVTCTEFTTALLVQAALRNLPIGAATFGFKNTTKNLIATTHRIAWIELGDKIFYIEPQTDAIMTRDELNEAWSGRGGVGDIYLIDQEGNMLLDKGNGKVKEATIWQAMRATHDWKLDIWVLFDIYEMWVLRTFIQPKTK